MRSGSVREESWTTAGSYYSHGTVEAHIVHVERESVISPKCLPHLGVFSGKQEPLEGE